MNPTREDRLREMGLGPVWKLRRPPAASPAAPDETPAAVASPEVTSVVPPPGSVASRPGPWAAPSGPGAASQASGATQAASAAKAPLGKAAAALDAMPEPPAFLDDAPPPDFDFAPPGDDLVEPLEEEVEPPSADAHESVIARMDWPALEAAVRDCRACVLGNTRRNAVFGVGDRQAGWMIIGEAPGAEEDARGEPFVGQAGQLLDAMLAALDMKRGEGVYIANVLKCRPPGNRNPEPQEVARCSPHLARQVALVKPRLLILMGRFAAHTMLSTDASIGSLRGRVHDCGGIPAIVTYHPAYLLRTPVDKAKSWEDLLLARATDRRLQEAASAPISPTS